MRWRHSIFESSMVWSYFRINAILYGAKAIQDEKYKSRDKFAFFFSTGFFFRRYFSSVWLNWLQNVNNKKEDQRQNIFENERKMLQFLYSVWKWFRNAHDDISFNCSNHCWSFLDEMYWMLMLSCESEILFELSVPKMNTRFYRFTLKRMF